jgi:uncharacterized protein (TIGR02996 family)
MNTGDPISSDAPPAAVVSEFLYGLEQTVSPDDRLVPVLRGSVLLRHWFGEAARPAADIDLEWFPLSGWASRFASPVEHARGLCMYAVADHCRGPIEFDPEVPAPTGAVSLWDYGTPGARCYTGWAWKDRGLRGVLQIDMACAKTYDLAGIEPEPVEFSRDWGDAARPLAYTPEMLLAAKLSWILRYLTTSDSRSDRGCSVRFQGESKDLMDAYLLVTGGRIRPAAFQNAVFAVAAEDELPWSRLNMLVDERLAFDDDGVLSGALGTYRLQPGKMLGAVITGLRPSISEVLLHQPYLRAIDSDPADEVGYLDYADWLERQGDARAGFVRLFSRHYFHQDSSSRRQAAAALPNQPGGWLYHVLGGPTRWRDICAGLENP